MKVKMVLLNFVFSALLANAAYLDEERAAAQASNSFGLELFKTTATETTLKNKFISPLSAYLALAMTYNGATDNTLVQMEKVLSLVGRSRDEANSANTKLLDLLNKKGGTEFDLSLANALFANGSYKLNGDYVDNVKDAYRAELSLLDFGDPASLGKVNGWVKKQTNNKIESILEQISEQMKLILLNAVYFKAQWAQPFEDETRLREFNVPGRKGVQVPMMHQKGYWKYVEHEGVKAIELPYGSPRNLETGEGIKESSLSMVALLPKEGQNLNDFTRSLTPEVLEGFTDTLESETVQKVDLALPKLEFNYAVELNEPLFAMGMTDAFSDVNASFKEMSPGKLFISLVKQKTFLAVNERGTEAAATTAVVMYERGSLPDPIPEMIVDRPYVFLIREADSNVILFMGSINEPEGGKIIEAEEK